MITAVGTDTVWLTGPPGNARLVWTTFRGEQSFERWRSRSVYYALPKAELALIDGDQALDLFWSISYEEIVGAMVLLARGDTVHEALALGGANVCQEPRLQDLNGDRQPEVISYEPGALTHDECIGDALAQQCMNQYPTSWPSVYAISGDNFVLDSLGVQRFYAEVATEYRNAANDLGLLLSQGNPPSPRCDTGMAASLRAMAERAEALGRAAR